MTNLVETVQYENGIYQLETTDLVLGGVDGVSNRPARELANRTAWLKQQIEEQLGLGGGNLLSDGNIQTPPSAFGINPGWDFQTTGSPDYLPSDERGPITTLNFDPALRVASVVSTAAPPPSIGASAEILSKPVPARPGERWQFALETGAVRCHAAARLTFLDSALDPLQVVDSALNTGAKAGSLTLLSEFLRVGDFATAPSNTAYARLSMRVIASGATGDASIARFAQPLLARASEHQSALSPWSPSRDPRYRFGDYAAAAGEEYNLNGMGYKWGEVDSSSTTGEVEFSPIGFSAYLFGVVFTHRPAAGGDPPRYIVQTAGSTSGFSWASWDLATPSAAAPGKFFWMAFGL